MYEISTATSSSEIIARCCDCSFCRMHAATTWSDAAGSATIRVNKFANLQKYRFGLQTADFFICKVCGAYIGAVLTKGDKLWSTLNLRLSGLNSATRQASYGDEDASRRVERRQQSWTPTIVSGTT